VDMTSGSRPAEPGELCPCGRPAMVVTVGGRFGDTGDCGLDDRVVRPDGVCVFCGDTVDHVHYAAAERAAGRPGPPEPDPRVRQSGRCPLYRLRLADPLPALHTGSVRRFALGAWRREQTRRRLIAEIAELTLAAGVERDPTEAAIAAEITVDQLGEVLAADTDTDTDTDARADTDRDGPDAPAFLLDALLADLRHADVTHPAVQELTVEGIAADVPGWESAEPWQRARLVVTRLRGELEVAGLLYAVPDVPED
jgi:hypothetical protein